MTAPIPAHLWRDCLAAELRTHARGHTQQSLADTLGLSQSTVGSWLRGHRNISHPQLLRLADALDFDPHRVLDAAEARARTILEEAA